MKQLFLLCLMITSQSFASPCTQENALDVAMKDIALYSGGLLNMQNIQTSNVPGSDSIYVDRVTGQRFRTFTAVFDMLTGGGFYQTVVQKRSVTADTCAIIQNSRETWMLQPYKN